MAVYFRKKENKKSWSVADKTKENSQKWEKEKKKKKKKS